MMLAYQPVRSLATLNIAINQGLASAKRILPIIDNKNKKKDSQKKRAREFYCSKVKDPIKCEELQQ